MHALGLPPGDPNVVWVGSDNGGLQRGDRDPLTGQWSFSGQQRSKYSLDISDICAEETADGKRLVYCIAGSGTGAGNTPDLRVLFRRTPLGAWPWQPVELDDSTHVWGEGTPPVTALVAPAQGSEKHRTPHTHMTPPSSVRVLPLPGGPGRHLLVVGGNTKSAPFDSATGRIRVLDAMLDPYDVPQSSGKVSRVFPYSLAPNFYCRLVEAPVSERASRSNWRSAMSASSIRGSHD